LSGVSRFAAAIEWAARTRASRERFVGRCAEGLTLTDVRDELAGGRPEIAELRLLPVVEAILAGKVAARRLLATAGLAEDVSLGEVDEEAWSLLVGTPDTVGP